MHNFHWSPLRDRPFNFWRGGGGGGWFWKRKNFLQALVGRKKLLPHIWNRKKNSCTAVRKKKKCYQVISSFRELCKIPAKLQPFFPCSLLNSGFAELLLRISNALHVRSTYQEIWVSFSGSLWLRKSGFLFFFLFLFGGPKENLCPGGGLFSQQKA